MRSDGAGASSGLAAEVDRWLPWLERTARRVEQVHALPGHAEVGAARRAYLGRMQTWQQLPGLDVGAPVDPEQVRGDVVDARRAATAALRDLVGRDRPAASLGQPR